MFHIFQMKSNSAICVHQAYRLAAPPIYAFESIHVLNYTVVEYTSGATRIMKVLGFRNFSIVNAQLCHTKGKIRNSRKYKNFLNILFHVII